MTAVHNNKTNLTYSPCLLFLICLGSVGKIWKMIRARWNIFRTMKARIQAADSLTRGLSVWFLSFEDDPVTLMYLCAQKQNFPEEPDHFFIYRHSLRAQFDGSRYRLEAVDYDCRDNETAQAGTHEIFSQLNQWVEVLVQSNQRWLWESEPGQFGWVQLLFYEFCWG